MFVVLDFEATCDEPRNPNPQEVIEFPMVAIDPAVREATREFHRYVRPRFFPRLSTFCTRLTGIEQATVDASTDFVDVLRQADAWIAELGGEVTVVTCGDWDLNTLLPLQCKAYGIELPAWSHRRINLKEVFARSPYGKGRFLPLQGMLEAVGLTFEGRPHSGIDDTRNIARIVCKLLKAEVACAPDARSKPNAGSAAEIGAVFAQLTPGCGKATAQRIEFLALDLARLSPQLLEPFATDRNDAVREAVAFIAGRLMRDGVDTPRMTRLLAVLSRDPNAWVRKKAQAGMPLPRREALPPLGHYDEFKDAWDINFKRLMQGSVGSVERYLDSIDWSECYEAGWGSWGRTVRCADALLMNAIIYDKVGMADLALRRGADPQAYVELGHGTLIMQATMRGNIEMCRLLAGSLPGVLWSRAFDELSLDDWIKWLGELKIDDSRKADLIALFKPLWWNSQRS